MKRMRDVYKTSLKKERIKEKQRKKERKERMKEFRQMNQIDGKQTWTAPHNTIKH